MELWTTFIKTCFDMVNTCQTTNRNWIYAASAARMAAINKHQGYWGGQNHKERSWIYMDSCIDLSNVHLQKINHWPSCYAFLSPVLCSMKVKLSTNCYTSCKGRVTIQFRISRLPLYLTISRLNSDFNCFTRYESRSVILKEEHTKV